MMIIYIQNEFSKLFPKTFAYLNFAVPLIEPEYVYKQIPNPMIFIEKSSNNGGVGKVKRKLFGKNEEVHIYLENLLTESGYFKLEDFNFENKTTLNKILKLIDAQPRFQRFLIHEYEHVLQGPLNFFRNKLKKQLEFAEKVLNLKYSKDYPFFQTLPIDFYGNLTSSKRKDIEFFLSIYKMSPSEVEARLREWIFLKVKNYDEPTIGAFDFAIKRDINKVKADYESINAGINEEESKEIQDKNKLFLLRRQKILYEIFLEHYPKIIKRAEELANIIKEKYRNATRQQAV